jgi:hypothetical protein
MMRAGLEDDFHRFLLQLTYESDVITALETRAERYPWSTCPDAGTLLTEQSVGRSLQVVASLDPHSHCTHLFELLVLSAAHAQDTQALQFDLRVPDRQDNRTCATLNENGACVLRWEVNGTLIEGPGEWSGRELRQFSGWKKSLSTALAERAMLLRRALYISNGRASRALSISRAADMGAARMGACFTYQMPRALDAFRSPGWARDFSRSGAEPLQDFNAP